MEKPKQRWTQTEVDVVLRLYPLGDVPEVARITGRSLQAVRHKAIELGLSKKFHWRGSTSPIGTEVLRSGRNAYVMVKVVAADGSPTWVRNHHLIWSREHGEFPPKGMRLVFKDGDRTNCAIENLELIPPSESAIRMTRLRAYPPALQESIRLLKILRKTLSEHQAQNHSGRSGPSIHLNGPTS